MIVIWVLELVLQLRTNYKSNVLMKALKCIFVMAIAIFYFNTADSQTGMQKSENQKSKTAPEYQCPMKCEGEKTYAKEGKCPVCQMGLKILNAKNPDLINYSPNTKADTTKKSIKAVAAGKMGPAEIIINYYSPGVRKRVIWCGLVPYNDVWVTGAHSATTVEIDKPFILGDKKIAAGKYALFTIPGETEWTVILNSNWQQHLADDYNAKEDIVRVKVKSAENKHTERLEYYIENQDGKKGRISFAWENLKVEVPLTIQ